MYSFLVIISLLSLALKLRNYVYNYAKNGTANKNNEPYEPYALALRHKIVGYCKTEYVSHYRKRACKIPFYHSPGKTEYASHRKKIEGPLLHSMHIKKHETEYQKRNYKQYLTYSKNSKSCLYFIH